MHESLSSHAAAQFAPVATKLDALRFVASSFGQEFAEDLDRLQVAPVDALTIFAY